MRKKKSVQQTMRFRYNQCRCHMESVVPLDESYLWIFCAIVWKRNVRIISINRQRRSETRHIHSITVVHVCSFDSVFLRDITSLSWKCVRSCEDNHVTPCPLIENASIMPGYFVGWKLHCRNKGNFMLRRTTKAKRFEKSTSLFSIVRKKE